MSEYHNNSTATVVHFGSPSEIGRTEYLSLENLPAKRGKRSHYKRPTRNKAIENAVYAHVQAVRVLGRTHINTSEIADALSLPVQEVNFAIDALREKGIKIL